MIKNQLADAGEVGSIPGSGRSPGGGHDNPLQDSCLENPMDRGVWWTTVQRVTNSWSLLKQLSMYANMGHIAAIAVVMMSRKY